MTDSRLVQENMRIRRRAQHAEEQVRGLWAIVVGVDVVPLNVMVRRAFKDPNDFYRHIDVTRVTGEGGRLEWSALLEEVDRLLAAKPELAG